MLSNLTIPFSRLVMALFAFGLIGTAIALFWITYLGSISIAEHEIARTAKSEAALARLAFRQHFSQLESQIRTIASNPDIRIALEKDDKASGQLILDQATASLTSAALDILIVDHSEYPGWISSSLGLIDVSEHFPSQVRQAMPPDLWLTYSDHSTDPMVVIMAISVLVHDPNTGDVIGRVIGGTSLSDSHFLPGTLASVLKIEDLGIYNNGIGIAGIGELPTSPIPLQLMPPPAAGTSLLQNGGLYIYTPLLQGFDGAQLSIVLKRPADTMQNVVATYSNLFTPFLFYIFVLVVSIALLFSRVTAASLQKLMSYTSSLRRNTAASIPQLGLIQEFNQLASMFQSAFESVRSREEQFRELIDGSMHGVVIYANHRILYVNDALLEIMGYGLEQSDQLIGSKIFSLYASEEHDRLRSYYDLSETAGAPRAYEVRGLHKGGQTVWLEQHVRIIEWGGVQAYYATITDISERKRQEELATKNAHYDILTGLPNRRLLLDRLQQTIQRNRLHGDLSALMILDLDRFKIVNESYGSKVGDQVITCIAERLTKLLGADQTVSRMSGDEFAIILSDQEDIWELENQARAILNEVSHPLDLEDGQQVILSGSLGITLISDDSPDDETLLLQADASMHQAKSEPGSCHRFFSDEMNNQIARAGQIEMALRQAIENGELQLYFQPIVDYTNGTLKKCEALARWENETLGSISPSEFIPIAEDSGLIVPLGEWVLKEACAFFQSCHKSGLPLDGISVNISPRQCRDSGFVDQLAHILDTTDIDPGCLYLEITENVMFEQDGGDSVEVLSEINALGVNISLDDFGTGYSSLSYLKRLPIDVLKIDRSFVKELERDADGQALIRAIVSMADSLGLEVICEGAETTEQCNLLVDLGCTLIQGFSIARPMPGCDMQNYIRNYQHNLQKIVIAS